MSPDERELIRELQQHSGLLSLIEQHQGAELSLQSRLREQYSAELVRSAMTLVDLRRKAQAKFARADQMWFDRVGLEQSTPEEVARHKAQRFPTDANPVYDLCSGIGSDSIALAAHGCRVVGIDLSPANCLRAELNAAAYGVADHVEFRVADATSIDIAGQWVHIDPDRRAGRQRVIRIEDYQPSLEFLQSLSSSARGAAIKLSPASNFGGKFSGCEIELISLRGECKEATVWTGELAGSVAMRATALPSGVTIAGNPWDYRPRSGPLGRYLYDPDPAVVRAGLIDQLAEELGLLRLDDAEEYLTSEELVESPLISAFEVVANLPHNDREVRNYFREARFGEVEIKSRHVPTQVEAMRKKLPLEGTGKSTLIIARLAGRTRAVVARRCV